MEGFDAFVVEVDVTEVVHALEDEVRRIVEHVGALVAAYFVEESLEGGSVVEVFSRVDFIGEVDATFVEVLKEWHPSTAQFFKGLLHQSSRALRPRVEIRPSEGA